MAVRDIIRKQFSAVLAGLALGVAIGLAGLFWLDSRVLLLTGMAVLAITIVAIAAWRMSGSFLSTGSARRPLFRDGRRHSAWLKPWHVTWMNRPNPHRSMPPR